MVKVSYKTYTFDKFGNVYKQSIRINNSLKNGINEFLSKKEKEAIEKNYTYERLYLKELNKCNDILELKDKTIYYLNLTQLKYIWYYLKDNRILLDRNTILIVEK